MKARKKMYIGIDPDINKSGVAFWHRGSEKLELFTYKFFDLFTVLQDLPNKEEVTIVVEAGWLNRKANFRQGYVKDGVFIRHSKAKGESIAHDVGRNAETGMKIVEMCEFLGFEYKLFKPTQKKTTPEQFTRITGQFIKNQEKIDAAMMVIGY